MRAGQMSTKKPVDYLTIRGFKSIKSMDRLKLNALNVLIGANGSGKSNFVSYFRMLGQMMAQQLQNWTTKQGTADRIVSFGIKETDKIESVIEFGWNEYRFELQPTVTGGFSFSKEQLFFDGIYGPKKVWLGSGQQESKLPDSFLSSKAGSVSDYCFGSITNWKVFHFHDTSETAGVKRASPSQNDRSLRSDASNLAPYLYRIQKENPTVYNQIRNVVSLAVPSFDDFVLRPIESQSGEQFLWLLWKQKDSDYVLWPSQLSDGSLRFICLVTALMQPDPPSTILIDEPELGLHPYAITLLAGLIRSASTRMQVIIATQSVPLVNEFTIDDLIVVESKQGASTFERKSESEYAVWLEDYTIGELWQKNILGGRPGR
jgi:predicted ATPase